MSISEVHKSKVVFKHNEDGELYQVVKSKEQSLYIDPNCNDFTHLSAEYIKSAAALIQLNKEIGDSFGAVPTYLALHGLELRLKGALHTYDPDVYSIQNLRKRKIGHSINVLIEKYRNHFSSLLEEFHDEVQKQIISIFDDYEKKDYEYLKNLGVEGKNLTVDFELIESVIFTMINSINNRDTTQ